MEAISRGVGLDMNDTERELFDRLDALFLRLSARILQLTKQVSLLRDCLERTARCSYGTGKTFRYCWCHCDKNKTHEPYCSRFHAAWEETEPD
jgi:hypothetical protein